MRKVYFTILTLFVAVTLNAQTINGWITNPGFETEDATTSTGAANWEIALKNGALATARVVTSADVAGIPEGTKALEIVVTNTGTGNHVDVRLVNTAYSFTNYYTVPTGDIGVNISYDVHATATHETQFRTIYSKNGGDINVGSQTKSVSQTKANAATGWEAFNLAKTISAVDIDNTNLHFRQEFAFAYQTGTYYIDNFDSSVDGAVSIPTSIGDVKNNDVKIWSTNRAINIMNKAGQAGLATVYDLSGRQIKQVELSTNENSIEMPQGGLYIVRSTIEGNVFTQKVVVK